MSGIDLAQCPWADCPHGERCVHAKKTDNAAMLAALRDVLALIGPPCKDARFGCTCHYVNPDDLRAALAAHLDLTDPEGGPT